ncbi:hypothetical protein AA313_de0208687 [Arthrobotrys entomopaga]|nr:hypothetical protein AA313_de0208687 [Arthrobotrys entomopaga]
MKFSIASLLCGTATLAAAAATMKCNANNCLRAVRASAFPDRPGSDDCSSYFRATYTSYITATATASATVTETISTLTIVPTAAIEKRQALFIPTAIPAYASACTDAVRYESACSCIGLTRTTVTTQVVVATVTVTQTHTATTVATTSVAQFIMSIVSNAPTQGPYIKTFLDASNYIEADFTTDECEAVPFYLDPATSQLFSTDYGSVRTSDGGEDANASGIYFGESTPPFSPMYCTIDANDMLSCTSGTSGRFNEFEEYANGYALNIGVAGTDWSAGNGATTPIKVIYI